MTWRLDDQSQSSAMFQSKRIRFKVKALTTTRSTRRTRAFEKRGGSPIFEPIGAGLGPTKPALPTGGNEDERPGGEEQGLYDPDDGLEMEEDFGKYRVPTEIEASSVEKSQKQDRKAKVLEVV